MHPARKKSRLSANGSAANQFGTEISSKPKPWKPQKPRIFRRVKRKTADNTLVYSAVETSCQDDECALTRFVPHRVSQVSATCH